MTAPAGGPIPNPIANDSVPIPAATWMGAVQHLLNLFSYVLGGFRLRQPQALASTSADRAASFVTPATAATAMPIAVDVQLEDTDNMWNPVAADTVVINTPGVYRVTGRIPLTQPNLTTRNASLVTGLMKNGPIPYNDPANPSGFHWAMSGTYPEPETTSEQQSLITAGAVYGVTGHVQRTMRLVAGDRLRLTGWVEGQNGTTLLTLSGGGSQLAARWIAP
jgi:hypothetical protein